VEKQTRGKNFPLVDRQRLLPIEQIEHQTLQFGMRPSAACGGAGYWLIGPEG